LAQIKSESVADFIPESVADFPRNTQPMGENANTETSRVRTTAFPASHVLGRKLGSI